MKDESSNMKNINDFSSSFRTIIAGIAPGAVGGVFCVFVGHPMDLVKVRMQAMPAAPITSGAPIAAHAMRTGTFASLANIFASEGIKGLYRGVSAPLAAITPSFAIAFWSNAAAQNYLLSCNEQKPLTTYQQFMAGAFTGIPMAFVIAPSERIKCLLQVNQNGNNTTMMKCAKDVYRQGGIRGLYKGLGVTMLRDVPGNAAFFGVYECTKRSLEVVQEENNYNHWMFKPLSILFAGGCGGVANWIVAIPMDTVKSRFQVADDGAYRGARHVYASLLKNEGWTGLYRGLGPALIRAFPANAATFAGAEIARNFLGITGT